MGNIDIDRKTIENLETERKREAVIRIFEATTYWDCVQEDVNMLKKWNNKRKPEKTDMAKKWKSQETNGISSNL